MVGWLAGWLVDSLCVVRLVGTLASWLVGCLVGRLACCSGVLGSTKDPPPRTVAIDLLEIRVHVLVERTLLDSAGRLPKAIHARRTEHLAHVEQIDFV